MVIANSAALNIEAYVSFDFLRVSAQRSGIAPLHVSFILNFFKRNIHTVLHSGYINVYPTNVQESSLLSISSPAYIVILFFAYLFFDDGHFDQCEVIPHSTFHLHASNSKQC